MKHLYIKMSALDPVEMRDIAARICRDYLTGAWKTISAEEIKLRKISGGLSNFLFYVSLPDGGTENCTPRAIMANTTTTTSNKRPRKDSFQDILEPKEVLLRIYGQSHGEQALETMVTESVVFTLLSERKLGPKLHGIFPGGRIEQYIPARPLATIELSDPKISLRIAQKMAEIHSLDIPVSKEPDWLWNTMKRWIQNVDTILSNTDSSSNSKDNEIIKKIKKIDFRHEMEWLKNVIEKNNIPVVFSHNDLQEGNILLKENDNIVTDGYSNSPVMDNYEESTLNENLSSIIITNNDSYNSSKTTSPTLNGNFFLNNSSRKRSLDDDCNSETNDNDLSIDSDLDNTRDSIINNNNKCNSDINSCDPELMIIDFEYCAYNYRGFDLANHFLEWTFDYTNENYPFYYYKNEQYPNMDQRVNFITAYLRQYHLGHDEEDINPDEYEIEEILNEVKCLTLASHLFWTLWSVVNVHQEIQFGYWEYALTRSTEYFRGKENYKNSTKID